MGAVETALCEYRPPCQEVQTKTQREAELPTQVGREQRASQLAPDISETEREREAAKDNLDFIARIIIITGPKRSPAAPRRTPSW